MKKEAHKETIAKEKPIRTTRWLVVSAACVVLALLIAGFFRAQEEVWADIEATKNQFNSEVQATLQNMRFLSGLSVFRNSIAFHSSTSIETILQEYLQKVAGNSVVAASVFDKSAVLLAKSFCQTPNCLSFSIIEKTSIDSFVKAKLSTNVVETVQASSLVGLLGRDDIYEVGLPILDDGAIQIGTLVFVLDGKELLMKAIPSPAVSINLWKISLNQAKSTFSVEISSRSKAVWNNFSRQLAHILASALIVGIFAFIFFNYLAKKLLVPFFWLSKTLDEVSTGKQSSIDNHRNSPIAKICVDLNRVLARMTETQKRLIQAESLAVIARTTQMLAHDVRAPFSKLHTVIDLLERAKSPKVLDSIASTMLPDITKSLYSVELLIENILAYSDNRAHILRQENPEELVYAALRTLATYHSCNDVAIEVLVQHSRRFEVDKTSILRVMLNILSNALDSLGGFGRITIKTSDCSMQGRDGVEISVDNSGPPIPSEDIGHVFDSFFTKGKRGGTGLGLAIAKTFVEAHGGEIGCESSESDGVRFYFRIAASEGLYIPKIVNFNSSEEAFREKGSDSNSSKHHLGLNVLVVEDEVVFQQGLLQGLESLSTDSCVITTSLAENAFVARDLIAQSTPDLILLDIDLGANSPDGLQILKEIRASNLASFVCIHSNRVFFESQTSPQELGADAAIPKPMTSENLSKIIASAIEKKNAIQNKPRVAVVDDEQCYLTAWQEAMTDADVITFNDPELFYDKIIDNQEVLMSLTCIIFDFYFRGTDMDRLKLVQTIRSRGFMRPIVLSTNAPYSNTNDSQDRFDVVINKRAMRFSDLKEIPEIAAALERTK